MSSGPRVYPSGVTTEDSAPDQSRPGRMRSYASSAFSVFADNRLALVGTVLILFFICFCFVGPIFYRTNQVATDVPVANQPPSLSHLLGTDSVGFDELGRLMAGGQVTLLVSLAVALLAAAFGLLWGAVAGFVGGLTDSALMRFVDALLAIPTLFLLIFLDAIFIPSAPLLVFVLAALAWLVPARLVRAEVLSLRSRPYVDAARCAGAGPMRVVLRHLVPNVFGTLVVNATFQVADAVLAIAALSFLGLGIPPPAATWGGMLSNGVTFAFAGYWWQIWPAGACIVGLVVGFNLLGDGLRDVVDVRLRKR